MPLALCMAETSSSDFVLWNVYLNQEINGFHREDHYWAQIAAEIRMVLAKNPSRIKTEHFLLKFERKDKKKTEMVIDDAYIERSKSFWFGVAGPPVTKQK